VTARLLVSGSRRHTDVELVRAVLVCAGRRLGRDTVLVHGAAAGVDSIAAGVWETWGLPVEAHPADWGRCLPVCPPLHRKVRRDGDTWCPTAGCRRNQVMVDAGADLMLALPLGPSAGTRDCARRARAAGIPTVLITGARDLDQVADLLLTRPPATAAPRPLPFAELVTTGGTR
jgi:hypothetical protein